MRKFFSYSAIYAALSFGIVSCSSDNNPPIATPRAILKFTHNGITDSIVGSLTESTKEGSYIKANYNYTPGGPVRGYELVSYRINPNNYKTDLYLSFGLTTGNLNTQNYTFVFNDYSINRTSFSIEGETGLLNATNSSYTAFKSSDNFVLTITRIQDGYADGVFSGELSDYTRCYQVPNCTAPKLQVTNGEFKNLRIIN